MLCQIPSVHDESTLQNQLLLKIKSNRIASITSLQKEQLEKLHIHVSADSSKLERARRPPLPSSQLAAPHSNPLQTYRLPHQDVQGSRPEGLESTTIWRPKLLPLAGLEPTIFLLRIYENQ